MSYLPQRPLGAASSSLGLGLGAVALAGAVYFFWPKGSKKRKGWLSQNTSHRRVCRIPRAKKPASQIAC
ncbi:MAG: hypothetical protein ABH877_04370 [bacterium]